MLWKYSWYVLILCGRAPEKNWRVFRTRSERIVKKQAGKLCD